MFLLSAAGVFPSSWARKFRCLRGAFLWSPLALTAHVTVHCRDLCSMATFIVTERESKAKHLQTVAGVQPSAYWLSTLLWDFINYCIPAVITIILVFAFSVSSLTTTENDVLGAFLLLLFLFGPAAAAFSYCVTFLFKSASLCKLCGRQLA